MSHFRQTIARERYAVCPLCVRDDLLRHLASRGADRHACFLCRIKRGPRVRTDQPRFICGCKAAIRFHYSEWNYHTRIGGERLESLLAADDNPIFHYPKGMDPLDKEGFVLSFLEPAFENQRRLSLITAPGRQILEHSPKPAIATQPHPLLERMGAELRSKNYFAVEREFYPKIMRIARFVNNRIRRHTQFHRARIGAEIDAWNFSSDMQVVTPFYTPWKSDELGAPPVAKANVGRMNRAGVSFLYLASDADTAVCEIRPHPGEVVSLGRFAANRSLRIADFTLHPRAKLYQNDEQLDLLHLIVGIDKTFATAAPPSDRTLYSVTQLLSDMIRRMGFQGAAFRSTVGAGYNLVVFEPDLFRWVSDSARVVVVKGLKYDYRPGPLFDPDKNYDCPRQM